MPQQQQQRGQEFVPVRVRIQTPFGTEHDVETEIPPGFKFTPDLLRKFSLELLRSGQIQIDPGVAKKNLLATLSALKPIDADAWINALRARPQKPGEFVVPITLDEQEAISLGMGAARGVLGVPAARGAGPVTLYVTPAAMEAVNKSFKALKVAYIMDELETPLQQFGKRGAERPSTITPQGQNTGVEKRELTSQYVNPARRIAAKYGVPEDLFLALVTQESGWNPNAKSRAGAFGLGQLMPGTAKALGVNPADPVENLDGSARYLRQQFDRFGSWELALAAYNAGPKRVLDTARKTKDGRVVYSVPKISETQRYVKNVMALAPQMPVGSQAATAKERAREMAAQQVAINPYQDPGQTAAIVFARLAKEGLTSAPPREEPADDFWSFLGRTFTLQHIDFGSFSKRVHTVLDNLRGDSPAVNKLVSEGFTFNFDQEEFFRNPSIETPAGRVSLPSPELVNALFAPTDNKLINLVQTALIVGRLPIPLRGASAGYKAAIAEGKPFMSALGMGLAGAVRAEFKTLGAFDALYGVAQMAPSLVLRGNLTKDDLVGGALQMVPFVNIFAPSIGEAFARNGVDGSIDWENSSLPSWYRSVMKSLVPTFQSVDQAVILPALALASRFSFRKPPGELEEARQTIRNPDSMPFTQEELATSPIRIDEQGARLVEEEPGVSDGGSVDGGVVVGQGALRIVDAGLQGKRVRLDAGIGVHDGDLVSHADTRSHAEQEQGGSSSGGERIGKKGRDPVLRELPKGYDVRRDTPPEMLPHGVEPGSSKVIESPDGSVRIDVATAEKTSTGVPFGFRHLPEDAPESTLDLVSQKLHAGEEAAVYSNDKSVARLLGGDVAEGGGGTKVKQRRERYLATGEARVMPDGTVRVLPIVYKVKRAYRVLDILNNPKLLRRAAKALGFASESDFVDAIQGDPPRIHVLEPEPQVLGGKRKSAIDENGFVVFVEDFTYRGEVAKTGNFVVDEAMRVVEHARTRGISLNDAKSIKRVAQEVGAHQAAIDYLLTADSIAHTETGAVVIRHAPRPEIVNPDVVDAIRAGVPIDAGTALSLGRHGLIEGRGPNFTRAEADAVARDAMNRRGRCP